MRRTSYYQVCVEQGLARVKCTNALGVRTILILGDVAHVR